MTATNWTNGDVSGSDTLTDNDHLYPSHINELRTAVNTAETAIDAIESDITDLQEATISQAFIVVSRDGTGDYDCDGTADEVQINQAIAALPATGGTVYLKPGNYVLSDSIEITDPNVRLIGSGLGTVVSIKANYTGGHIFLINEALAAGMEGIEIAYMKIDGNADGAGNSAIDKQTIQADLITKSHFHHLYLVDSSGSSIWLTNSSYNSIHDNYMDGSVLGAHIRLYTSDGGVGSNNNIIRDNFILNVDLYGGMVLNDVSGTKIFGNYVYNVGESGIEISYNDYGNNVEYNIIQGNYFEKCSQVTNAAAIGSGFRTIICDNIIYDCKHIGINMDGSVVPAMYMKVTNNRIRQITGSGCLGMKLSGAKYNQIVGNFIEECAENGMAIGYGTPANDNQISNNYFKDNGQTTNNTYSDIILDGSSLNNIFTGNRFLAIASNKVKYHIRESSSADNSNYYHGNMWRGAVTAGISTQGAQSVSTANVNL